MTNTSSNQTATPTRRTDCGTEPRCGNTGLTVFGCFKQDTTDTAAGKAFISID